MRDDEESLDQVVEAETAPKSKPLHSHPAHKPGEKETFLDRAWETQERLEQKWTGLGSGRFARVLRMARKPEPEEFRQSATIVLVGIAIIGGLGFSVYLLMNWIIKDLLHA
ncbi:MAG: protein transport protein subunit gamma [Thermoplasmata archaeon]|nr:protein transport protein subunit gamma [Thermoplasmata archaeon]